MITKKPAAKKTAAKKVAVKRGGRRENAGRQAPDGATRVVTTSIGFTEKQRKFLATKDGGASVYLRKIIDVAIAREEAKQKA